MSLRTEIVKQFGKPTGLIGQLARWIMANRPSNIRRNDWTVELLKLEPQHRVLELGFGPGLALKACANVARHGRIVGLDHSEEMLRQATRRLAPEIRAGRVRLELGGIDNIGSAGGPFDRIYSINVVGFLPDLPVAYRAFYDALADGGMTATTFQPRTRKPTRQQAYDMAERVAEAMRYWGFSEIAVHELDLGLVPAVCITGIRRDPASDMGDARD